MEGKQHEAAAIVVSQFGEPSVLEYKTVHFRHPAAGEVLVDVKAVGINPLDAYIRAGGFPGGPTLPYTPGHDGAGVVEAVGEGVAKFKAGDRVYFYGTITGAYAAKALVKATNLYGLPNHVSFSQGATLGIPYATAYRALVQYGKAKPSETVFIHGATGGVGIAAVQFARALGLRVLGTGGTKEGRELVLKLGAHHVFDHRAPDYIEKVKEVVKENGGVNLVLEVLADVNLNKDISLLTHQGRVVIIGSRGTIEINPGEWMFRECTVSAIALLNASPEDIAEAHCAIRGGLDSGALNPVVAKELPLSQASVGHHEILASSHAGNIVLIP